MRSTSGTTRSISSCTATGGVVVICDSPPTSITSAPSDTSLRARTMRASNVARRAPSPEKESGVALRIPIRRGRSASTSVRPPARRVRSRPRIGPMLGPDARTGHDERDLLQRDLGAPTDEHLVQVGGAVEVPPADQQLVPGTVRLDDVAHVR